MGVQNGGLSPGSAVMDAIPGRDTSVAVQERVITQKPPLYAVFLLNDDYTPMEFVIHVLEKHFHKDHASATDLMLKVHNEGRALCGIYPFEIAETKLTVVTEEARQNGHPLQCVMERA
ncbi:MAG: ATP-dependent Clp protease adapter ClpS [Proteobacteria bacterium]|nr:ATP-dependent Clp protease adapter ClpS [Pseudomonadota bacterium]